MSQDVGDTAVVVSVGGDVDSSTLATLAARLDAALVVASDHPARLLVIALGGVVYFGSAGLNAILESHEKGLCAGVVVRVVAPNAEVRRPIEVTKLDDVLHPYQTVADAIEGDSA